MKLKEIKSMFQPGQTVKATREGGKPLTVIGNTGTTVLGANNVAGEIRTVKAARSGDWVFTRQDGKDIYTQHPKASEILESRPGFLKFKYDNGVIVTLEAV